MRAAHKSVELQGSRSDYARATDKARNQLLFGDNLQGKSFPSASYMQPQVHSSNKLNTDPDTRVSTVGVDVPPAVMPAKSHLAARIEQRMAQRMQDSALQCERDAQTKPYLYKERDVLLAHEDNRRESLRLRELHGALSYTRAGIYLHELYE